MLEPKIINYPSNRDKFRFFNRIEPDLETGCYNLRNGRNVRAYSRVTCNGQQVSAHRLAYVIAYGPIPEGMDVCHKCDNPICVNPSHLFAGTAQDNMLDKERKGRANHPFGSNNPTSKLTEQQVLKIRSLYKPESLLNAHDGYSMYRLAKEYGVNINTINHIVLRKTWKHI